MDKHITARGPADIIGVIPHLLGFMPEESLVLVGIGGGPTARVGLAPPAALRDAFAPAVPHWQEHGVVAVAYTDDDLRFETLHTLMDRILPGVTVHDSFRVHEGRFYKPFDSEGTAYVAPNPLPDEPLPAWSRDEVTQAAQEVTSVEEAEAEAWMSWHRGNGARAWIYHDRAVELAGDASDSMRELARLIQDAVNPKTHNQEG